MTRDIRTFIRDLGPDAAGFFGVTPPTIERWLKHGNIPLNKASKAFEAMAKEIETNLPQPTVESTTFSETPESVVDPAVMEEQAVPPEELVRPPAIKQALKEGMIEVDPSEQSAGSFVRPGRIPAQRPAPRVMQPRQAPAPVLPRTTRPDGITVDVYTPEQYAEKMRSVKPIGSTDWAAPHKQPPKK